MRFYIDDDSKEEKMRIYLQEGGGRVHIMGVDIHGRAWTLFSLLPDGTFRRPGSIKAGTGIQIDPNGRIKETKDF